MGDKVNGEKPLSILEKFRQLEKLKEAERAKVEKVSKSDYVGAIYLNKNKNSNKKTFGFDNKRGGFHGKRKYDGGGERSSAPEWKKLKGQETNVPGHIGLKAEEVGITEYISLTPGFKGIIKQRFSDFLVNEISEEGEIIKLTSTELPSEESDEDKIILEKDDDLFKILPKEYWDKLYNIVETENVTDSLDVEVTDWSRDRRVQVHTAVKNLFKEKVISNTVDVDGKKILQVKYAKEYARAKKRSYWRHREYTHFVMYKENIDTLGAINIIAQRLRKRGNMLQICGTKDKRGMTAQRVSVKRIDAKRLKEIQPLRNIHLGNFEYSKFPFKLGQLKGNRFRLIVRNIDATDDMLEDVFNSLKNKGFINYFGMQRFGASALVPTHLVGKAIIHQNWKLAVEHILKPREGEKCNQEVAKARKIWWETKDAQKALKCIHWKNCCLESKVLQGLVKNGPTGYLNALENLPRNSLMFYCHGFQSYIWNKVVSRRIKEFGYEPIVGDIILIKDLEESDGVDNKNISSCANKSDCAVEKSDDEEENKEGEEDNCKIEIPTDDEALFETSKFNKIMFLTEDNIKDYSLEDIVYPMAGHDISYPNNPIKNWYTEFLNEEGITEQQVENLKPFGHLFPMYGTYRHIISKPENVHWSVLNYNEENRDLQLSDLDVMRGVKPIESVPGGKFKALSVQFDLSSSTYATMALREIMKCETSQGFQAALTARHISNGKANDATETNTNNGFESKSELSNGSGINGHEENSNTNIKMEDTIEKKEQEV